jgi:predicted metal-dependent hydrolase
MLKRLFKLVCLRAGGADDGDPSDVIRVGARHVRLVYLRNARAKRYILRVRADGSARVTMPKFGSYRAARLFAERHVDWIREQLDRPRPDVFAARKWQDGTPILWRGRKTEIRVCKHRSRVRVGDQDIQAVRLTNDLRDMIVGRLREVARRELPPRTRELADEHGLRVRRVTVRDQRTRWGSCSSSGAISLNWRLVQCPAHVRDYVILHELMHLRHLDHSERFWKRVEAACPDYLRAEAWLKTHCDLLDSTS